MEYVSKIMFLSFISFIVGDNSTDPPGSGYPTDICLKQIDFCSHDTIISYIDYIAKEYKDFVEIHDIGKSWENRPLRLVVISSPLPNVHLGIWVDAGSHGREWVAPAVALRLLQELVENRQKNIRMMMFVKWYILVLMNPDGYEYSRTKERHWRKNRNPMHTFCMCPNILDSVCGVDINRNFDIDFGGTGTSADPCSEMYHGVTAFSEPESRAVAHWLVKHKSRITMYISMHAFYPCILIPWGNIDKKVRDFKELYEVATAIKNAIAKVNEHKYEIFHTADYGIGAGGSDDYAKSIGIKFVYTIELPGRNFASKPGDLKGYEFKPEHIKDIGDEMLEGFREAARIVTIYGEKKKYFEELEDLIEEMGSPNITLLRSKFGHGIFGESACMSWNEFCSIRDVNNYLKYLEEEHGDFVDVHSVGKSHRKHPIKVVRVTNGDKPKIDKPAVLVEAGVHAREWIGPPVALHLLQELVENRTKNSEMLEALDWYIMPMVNPDGYSYSMEKGHRLWRKNRAPCVECEKEDLCGVDLNRNYDFHWDEEHGASVDGCSSSYRGPYPESEPETQAVANFLREKGHKILLYITLHSHAQALLVPWAYTKNEKPNDVDEMLRFAQGMADAIIKVNGHKYDVGVLSEKFGIVSGSSCDIAKHLGVKFSIAMELPGKDFGKSGGGFEFRKRDIWPLVQETFAGFQAAAKQLQSYTNVQLQMRRQTYFPKGSGQIFRDLRIIYGVLVYEIFKYIVA